MKNKEIRLLAKCEKCDCCKTVTLSIKGYIDKDQFIPEIEGDIAFSTDALGYKRWKNLKDGKEYYITITLATV